MLDDLKKIRLTDRLGSRDILPRIVE